jgi:hypothetical protein
MCHEKGPGGSGEPPAAPPLPDADVRRRAWTALYGGGMDHERQLAPSAFPGDEGVADPGTRRALAAAVTGGDPADYLRAVAALCQDRLLVPVVATATRLGETVGGLSSDKEAEMSVVMLQAADGRRALLAFTGLDALQAWQGDARPVAVTLDKAAQTARAEGVAALLVDFAGPHPLVLEGEVLTALAAGQRLIETEPGVFGWLVDRASGDDQPGT